MERIREELRQKDEKESRRQKGGQGGKEREWDGRVTGEGGRLAGPTTLLGNIAREPACSTYTNFVFKLLHLGGELRGGRPSERKPSGKTGRET